MTITKQQIYKIISRKHGLKVSSDAIQYLVELFEDSDNSQLMENIDLIIKEYVLQEGGGKSIEKSPLELVVETLFKKQNLNQFVDQETENLEGISQYFKVLDTFNLPQYSYRQDDKSFYLDKSDRSLLATADKKSTLYRNRYDILKQRFLRNEAFRMSNFSADKDSYFKTTPIIHLKGKPPGRYLLFGMLTQIEERLLHLEDLDACIQVDFATNFQKGVGIFTRNCFVLAQGEYTADGIFLIDIIGMPLPERREDSLLALTNNVNLFGGPTMTDDHSFLLQLEKSSDEVSFVLISDLWLDQPQVFEKLRLLFEGYSEAIIPLAFIFIGNFQSTPFNYTSQESSAYRESFDQLANLISEFPEIAAQSHFIFVPGPNDPWAGNIVPRPPIPVQYRQKLNAKVKNVHFTGNPCRIKYCTQDIIIFREDLMNTMRRNAIIPVTDDQDMPLERHMIATILDQSYLTPVPIDVKPVYWAHSNALMVYPQPHLLVLADRFETYEHMYEGCLAVNPGSFPNSDFQFLVYQPATNVCETSKIS
ncbi:DNA polymerase alpha/epsilon subunit B-domain-containing protein [Globomyces pollinis-pini]|nr:DNA polymerase alpha/epsilon subunit B-domain-containing protein [Globomyces pollinis-pini]